MESHQQPRHARFPSDDTIVSAAGPEFMAMNHPYNPSNDVLHPLKEAQFVTVEDATFPQAPGRSLSWKSSKQSGSTSEKSRLRRISSLKLSKTGTWTFEIVSLLVAIGAVASIIAVLAYYDGRPLPEWPWSITINALIAVLTTIANTGMAVPLSNGLGQLKWDRFKTGYAPLTDMEDLDDASRGALGAINLLRKLRGGVAGSFGAIAVIVALFLSPFAQQVVIYRTMMRPSDVGATNLRAMTYSWALPGLEADAAFVPILPLKAAVYNGLFAENGKPLLNLPVSCQTGNCTWEPFDTLAVCNSCVDMTQYMTRYCANGTQTGGDMSECGWSLPNGAVLNDSSIAFSMTSQFPSATGESPYSEIMKLSFMGTESQSGEAGNLQPWARQCTLQTCVQTIESAIVNGELSENVTEVTTNRTVVTTQSDSTDMEPVLITTTNDRPQTYTLTKQTQLGMQSWFAQLFADGSASRNTEYINRTLTSPSSAAVVVNLTVGISSGATFFDTDIVQAFYWNYYEYESGIDMLMHDLAASLTVSFRAIPDRTLVEAVNGTALRLESMVHVRWGFVAAPILALVLTAGFLAAAMQGSWRRGASLWKSSVLAVLFHGLDEDAREKFEEVGGLEEKKKLAKGVRVMLDERGAAGTGGLLRCENPY
ncbi:DUF3176 domain-containing protein [Pleurostoma richardsiae]|uniref:DUF3176 domain-containing protein n=1 Tax=Pleurostoma richardsiae TaxID=41990 RepID=A0AA38VTH0_9PEZI|nr:DUF3176 domain-containing protein [Pleurostoma richardsiae]